MATILVPDEDDRGTEVAEASQKAKAIDDPVLRRLFEAICNTQKNHDQHDQRHRGAGPGQPN